MEAQLKPGCLAIIIRSRHSTLTGPSECACAMGKIVTVIGKSLARSVWEVTPIKCESDGHPMRYGTNDSLRPLPDEDDVREHDIAQIDIVEKLRIALRDVDVLTKKEKENGSVSQ